MPSKLYDRPTEATLIPHIAAAMREAERKWRALGIPPSAIKLMRLAFLDGAMWSANDSARAIDYYCRDVAEKAKRS